MNAFIYNKSLRYSLIRSPDQSFGQLMNYMQVDSAKFVGFVDNFSAMVTMPCQILVGVYLLYSFIGISFLSGVFIILVAVYINYLLNLRNMRLNCLCVPFG